MSFLPPYAAQSSLLAVVADPALRSAVATSLARGLGVTVEQAPDVPSAMALLARTAFALVIVDQSLPGEHVPSFIRTLRSQYGEVPVMALVDRVGPEQMADLMQAGVTTVVEKPVSAERLMLRVADALGPRVPTQSPTEQFNEHLTLAWQAMSNRQLDVASAHAQQVERLASGAVQPAGHDRAASQRRGASPELLPHGACAQQPLRPGAAKPRDAHGHTHFGLILTGFLLPSRYRGALGRVSPCVVFAGHRRLPLNAPLRVERASAGHERRWD